ncbi:hypothetical protein [Micromonospora echinofusca]|uniref:hypothetical protein n=1 Tax=Micromonospora echinofusca TaxID=47858 RepID=UPI0033F7A424
MSDGEVDGAAGSDGVVLSVDLYAEERVLAAPGARLVRQAAVRFGRPMIYPVRADELTGLNERRTDLHERQFLLVQFPYELEALPINRRYESLTVQIDFGDDAVLALDVMPPTYDGPDYPDLDRVDLDVRGIGRNRVSWDLRCPDPDAGLRPRSRIMQVILDAPMGVQAVSAIITAEAVVVRRVLGLETRSTATTPNGSRITLSLDGRVVVGPAD